MINISLKINFFCTHVILIYFNLKRFFVIRFHILYNFMTISTYTYLPNICIIIFSIIPLKQKTVRIIHVTGFKLAGLIKHKIIWNRDLNLILYLHIFYARGQGWSTLKHLSFSGLSESIYPKLIN